MSLIVGQYYRGNPDQKPKQWGSRSLVSATIAERLGEWYGIAWDDVLLFMPFWNPGTPVDYSSFGVTPTVNSSPTFKHNGMYFDGVDDSLEFGAVDWLGGQTTDKPFSVVGIGSNAIADGLVFLSGASDDPNAISNCIQFQSRTNGGIIFGLWGNTDPSSHRIRILHDTLPDSRGIKLAGTYAGNKNVSGLNVYSSGQKLSTYTDVLGSYNGCDPTNVLMAESLRNSDYNSFKEQNILSLATFGIELTEYQACGLTEDFYSLFQPPTFRTYFIPDVVSVVNLSGAVSSTTSAIGQIDKHSVLSGFGVDALAISSGLASNKKDVNGSITAGTITDGSLSATKKISGESSSDTSLNAVFSATKNIIGDVSASTTLSGGTSMVVGLSGDIDAESFPGGQLSITRRLSGGVVADSFISGDLLLKGTIRLSGSVGASCVIDSQVSVQKQLTGLVDSVTSVLGEISRIGEGLGIIIDPSIESITATRIIETITIKREIESI